MIEAVEVDDRADLAVRARFEAASDGAAVVSASATTRSGELAAEASAPRGRCRCGCRRRRGAGTR